MLKPISIITESLIFLSNEIKKYYEFSFSWYRKKEIRENVLKYYYVLSTILKNHPKLKKCLTRCKYCRIFFLTSPRNTGRSDIGCPFGCREKLHKKNSAERSVKYYQTKEGKIKKSYLNQKRSENKEIISEKIDINTFEEKFVKYLKMIASLIERRTISESEIITILRKKMRQHPLDKEKKILYLIEYLNKKPP